MNVSDLNYLLMGASLLALAKTIFYYNMKY